MKKTIYIIANDYHLVNLSDNVVDRTSSLTSVGGLVL